jgi:hypothetical protein
VDDLPNRFHSIFPAVPLPFNASNPPWLLLALGLLPWLNYPDQDSNLPLVDNQAQNNDHDLLN